MGGCVCGVVLLVPDVARNEKMNDDQVPYLRSQCIHETKTETRSGRDDLTPSKNYCPSDGQGLRRRSFPSTRVGQEKNISPFQEKNISPFRGDD